MAGQSRLICVSSLLAILLSAPVFATSSPLPPVNGTNQQTNPALKPRVIPTPDADGWIPFDSVGMMLPVKLTEDSDTSPPPGCNTIECKQRMSYMSSSSGGVPLPPGLGLTKRDLPRQGSRDLVRRKAAIGLDDAGEPVYRLADYDDDEEEEDDNGDDEEEDVEDYGDDEEGYYEGDENDENDENSLAKRHLPLLKGVSVLGAPTFSRRSEGFLASLFRRKKKNSKKVADLARPRRKKNKNKSKSKSKQLKKIKKKGKGKFNIGGIDLMKGATILTTITWYTGIDLLNPYCDRKTKWTPTDDSMIIAVTEKWSLRPACGEFMEITTQDDKAPRSIIARVVDLCGGCIPEVPHADLSKAAFSKLYHLDVGRVHGLKMRRVGAPKRWSERLFGPKVL